MADVYCDMSLDGSPLSGLNDGTSWANAYVSLPIAMNGSNVVAGDVLYVKGAESVTGTQLRGATDEWDNRPIIIGVKSATTNEPPIASDVIPGWRTGEARTEANRAYLDPDVPTMTITSGNTFIERSFSMYGINFTNTGAGSFNLVDNDCFIRLEECFLDNDGFLATTFNGRQTLLNCKHNYGGTDDEMLAGSGGDVNLIGCTITADSAKDIIGSQGIMHYIACDISDKAHTLFTNGGGLTSGQLIYQNCKLHPSTVIANTGKGASTSFVEVYQSSSVAGKTSGTIQNYDSYTDQGDVVEETTAVRTGGAEDESGPFSLAMTPIADSTQENNLALETTWMGFKISGDGTAQTLTVYIANSGAADYNNDDVWLEIIYPSESGTAQYDMATTQMNLLATPAVVPDDPDSVWGAGANNPQQLIATLRPDYIGVAYCQVKFAKRFAANPETLFVDPLPVVS